MQCCKAAVSLVKAESAVQPVSTGRTMAVVMFVLMLVLVAMAIFHCVGMLLSVGPGSGHRAAVLSLHIQVCHQGLGGLAKHRVQVNLAPLAGHDLAGTVSCAQAYENCQGAA